MRRWRAGMRPHRRMEARVVAWLSTLEPQESAKRSAVAPESEDERESEAQPGDN